MMPEAAIAFACRSAIAVSCGSVLTVDKPCACRYREIVSAMSSACASVAVIATTAPSKTVFMTRFPTSPAMKQHSLTPDEADIGHRIEGSVHGAAPAHRRVRLRCPTRERLKLSADDQRQRGRRRRHVEIKPARHHFVQNFGGAAERHVECGKGRIAPRRSDSHRKAESHGCHCRA